MVKRFVRIICEFAGNNDEPPQPDYKVILVGVVEGTRLVRQSTFGIAHDGKERCPFELEPPLNGRRHGALNFGSGYNELREPTNLFDRPIGEGTLYTRWIKPDGQEIEQPYRIVQIIAL